MLCPEQLHMIKRVWSHPGNHATLARYLCSARKVFQPEIPVDYSSDFLKLIWLKSATSLFFSEPRSFSSDGQLECLEGRKHVYATLNFNRKCNYISRKLINKISFSGSIHSPIPWFYAEYKNNSFAENMKNDLYRIFWLFSLIYCNRQDRLTEQQNLC
jgi:hypothetical protein